MVIVGGGATGVGIALDAASRGYKTALFEQSDFGKGTSSRSTKLIHGGVRYLAQGNISLVREALHERSVLMRNAPHLVHALGFVIPAESFAEAAFYRTGIGLYDVLAGADKVGRSALMGSNETHRMLPGLREHGIRAGVLFHDCQFDDARLLISLVRTASAIGAACLNYGKVESFLRASTGAISGVIVQDTETARSMEVRASVVINATGAFTDSVRNLASPSVPARVSVSQGSHVVVDRSFLPSNNALLVPKTKDGRVLFAIPWLGHTLIGTTDVPIADVPLEPRPSDEEVDFILETAAKYLAKKPRRSDVLSTFAGIRPLIRSGGGSTASLSRDHSIYTDPGGLITIAGGKWTTYRRMAQDCVDTAARQARLSDADSQTAKIALASDQEKEHLARDRPELGEALYPGWPWRKADVVWAVRAEMARTVEDVLARRTRLLFLNASAAMDAAETTAGLMASELGRNDEWIRQQVEQFRRLAQRYRLA